jgi:sugar phosphate isomerase/epimerase
MQLGIFAKTFPRPTLEETLDAVAGHGLTEVQFNLSCAALPTLPDRIDEDLCVWIARLIKERGMTMAAISGTFNLCDPDTTRLQDNLNRLDVLAAACRWLDTRIITLCTGTTDPEDMWRWHPGNVRRSTWETLIQSMSEAVRIADWNEVKLAFEPEINNVVNSVSKARRLLDEIDSPWLKVVIDPANLVRPGEFQRKDEVLEEAFDWLGPDIVLAHAKDPTYDSISDEPLTRDEFLELDRSGIRFLQDRFQFAEISLGREQLPEQSVEARVAQRKILCKLAFYRQYFSLLKKIEYTGAIVMHGLEEPEVDQSAFLLRMMIERLSLET